MVLYVLKIVRAWQNLSVGERCSFRHAVIQWLPNKPPFDTIARWIAAPIDYLGDLLRRFPDQRAKPSVKEIYYA
jgi:hypothetical protein